MANKNKDNNKRDQIKRKNGSSNKGNSGKGSFRQVNPDNGKDKGFKPDASKDNRTYSIRDTSNNPIWWIPKGLSADQIASYPWNTVAGFDMKKLFAGEVEEVDADSVENIAGIMRFNIQSTFGVAESGNSALNKASLGLFADILTKNSSNVPFEHMDLTMSIIAISDIDAVIAKGLRAYGLIKQYPTKNKYVAKALVHACGFDYDELIKDPFGFISRLNIYIGRRNRFYVPKGFSWREREVWLNSFVYKDGTDEKSQLYVFNKDSYSVWDTGSDVGTQLLQRSMGYPYAHSGTTTYKQYLTPDEYFDVLDQMLVPLENDQDVYIMQGYILKRYDMGELIQFPHVTADYEIEPVIDYPVLSMIQNAKLYSDKHMSPGTTWEYTPLSQSNGSFAYRPQLETTYYPLGNHLITSCETNPSSENTIEATRFIVPLASQYTVTVDTLNGPRVAVYPLELNADIINSIRIVTVTNTGAELGITANASTWQLFLRSDKTLTDVQMKLITQLGYFDFHPLCPVFKSKASDGNTKTVNFIGIIGDVDNTMILSNKNLSDLDYVTTYGLMKIVDL